MRQQDELPNLLHLAKALGFLCDQTLIELVNVRILDYLLRRSVFDIVLPAVIFQQYEVRHYQSGQELSPFTDANKLGDIHLIAQKRFNLLR